mmetsp:Transcript_47748/g.126335  ORF Transcript_47748/g.126335 Transcript_47748/m.126335 type:complete len:292 (-) Transcript_47748:930-1805(-)
MILARCNAHHTSWNMMDLNRSRLVVVVAEAELADVAPAPRPEGTILHQRQAVLQPQGNTLHLHRDHKPLRLRHVRLPDPNPGLPELRAPPEVHLILLRDHGALGSPRADLPHLVAIVMRADQVRDALVVMLRGRHRPRPRQRPRPPHDHSVLGLVAVLGVALSQPAFSPETPGQDLPAVEQGHRVVGASCHLHHKMTMQALTHQLLRCRHDVGLAGEGDSRGSSGAPRPERPLIRERHTVVHAQHHLHAKYPGQRFNLDRSSHIHLFPVAEAAVRSRTPGVHAQLALPNTG